MKKLEIIEAYKDLLSDVLEQIAFSNSGMERPEDTIEYIQEACENAYRNLTGDDYEYEDEDDDDDEEDE